MKNYSFKNIDLIIFSFLLQINAMWMRICKHKTSLFKIWIENKRSF